MEKHPIRVHNLDVFEKNHKLVTLFLDSLSTRPLAKQNNSFPILNPNPIPFEKRIREIFFITS